MAIIINGTSGSITGAATIDATTITENGVSVANETQLWLKADNADVNTQLSMKANTADLKEIGVGQTWQSVTGSRVLGALYANTTGKPILVIVTIYVNNSSNAGTVGVGGGVGYTISSGAVGSRIPCSFVVKNNEQYSVSTAAGQQIDSWLELR